MVRPLSRAASREYVERSWMIEVFESKSGHCVVDGGVRRVAFKHMYR
jgi:hypothetical protein